MTFSTNIRINIISAYRALLRNKMRSLLTSVGIIIGISSVITMIGLGNSAKKEVIDQIFSYGKNGILFEIIPPRELTTRDLEKLKSQISQIEYISPADYEGVQTQKARHTYLDKNIKSKVQYANRDYFEITARYASKGRIFTKGEIEQKSSVVIIGEEVKNGLFRPGEDPIGKDIWIYGNRFKVIGVLDEKGEALSGRDFDNMSVIPYTTGLLRLRGKESFRRFYISTNSEKTIQYVIEQVEKYLVQKYQILEKPEEYYKFSTSEDRLKMAREITSALAILLGGIAAISLFVGGVGIMNIMLVSVTERTREIGIRMAIGAKKIDIMSQFLIESVMLSFLGGIIGIILGLLVYFLIIFSVNLFLNVSWQFLFSFGSIVLAVVFVAAVGIFFGYYPSRQAAELKPIEALRFE
jgi:putative ABC transport system permease protein